MMNTKQTNYWSKNKQSNLFQAEQTLLVYIIMFSTWVPVIFAFINNALSVYLLLATYTLIFTTLLFGHAEMLNPTIGSVRKTLKNIKLNPKNFSLKGIINHRVPIVFGLFQIPNIYLSNIVVNDLLLTTESLKINPISTQPVTNNLPLVSDNVANVLTYTIEVQNLVLNIQNLIPINAFFLSVGVGIYYGISKDNTIISGFIYGVSFYIIAYASTIVFL